MQAPSTDTDAEGHRHARGRDYNSGEHAIGPYNHVAKVGTFITIGGTAGMDPATGELAGDDVVAQTSQSLDSLRVMLESVGSDLAHVVHVTSSSAR